MSARQVHSQRWIWRVSCYYADTVKWPKRPGELAIQTVHASDVSKDVEVAAAESREDIGEVIVDRPPSTLWWW
jgi:hypothetical protein